MTRALTKSEHKRDLLRDLAVIISINDDLCPEELNDSGPEYEKWNQARNELVKEFEERSRS